MGTLKDAMEKAAIPQEKMEEILKASQDIQDGHFREKGVGPIGDLYRALTDDSQEEPLRMAWAQTLELASDLVDAGEIKSAFVLTSSFPDSIPEQEKDEIQNVVKVISDVYYQKALSAAVAQGDEKLASKVAKDSGFTPEEVTQIAKTAQRNTKVNRRSAFVFLSFFAIAGSAGFVYGAYSMVSSVFNLSPTIERVSTGVSEVNNEIGQAAAVVVPAAEGVAVAVTPLVEAVIGGEGGEATPSEQEVLPTEKELTCAAGAVASIRISEIDDLSASQIQRAEVLKKLLKENCSSFNLDQERLTELSGMISQAEVASIELRTLTGR